MPEGSKLTIADHIEEDDIPYLRFLEFNVLTLTVIQWHSHSSNEFEP